MEDDAPQEWQADPEAFARRIGLIYVTDSLPGYRRKRWGRGFTYVTEEGTHVRDPELRARFERLVIPPAWTDVWISAEPQGHIQATGRDDRGRKQYIYHPEWERHRQIAKFRQLVPFAERLPEIRKWYEAGLRQHRLGRTKVLATVVRLLDETLIRIGNVDYARTNRSFGLTTLRDRHVDFVGEGCVFLFAGKSGKQQEVMLDDPRLARVVRDCRDVPGYDLFQYYDEGGGRSTISSTDVNDLLRDLTGLPLTAKTFRTWGATVFAASILHGFGPPRTEREADQAVVDTVKSVADRLGNTPAVSRSYYIHPLIPQMYREGTLQARWSDLDGAEVPPFMERDETIVLRLLREAEP